MKPRIISSLVPSSLALIAVTFSALPALAQTTWDGGGGADTNVDTAANWNNDIAPSLTGTVGVTFTSANNVATLNVPAAFRLPNTTTPAVQFGGSFTLETTGSNSLTLYGTNSGGQSVLRTNSAASSVTINAPIEVFSTASVSPLGNLLVITVNNGTAANTALNITGGISRASGSPAASYDIRFGNNVALGVVAAKAKISGTISGMANLVNANTDNARWSGDLIIAGDQTSLTTSNITISGGAGFGTPQTSARIVLGESDADDQTWNNITLNNVMNLAIGGNITANAFSGNTVNTRITGASATGNISFNSGTIGTNVVLGGAGTNQDDLSIIKKSSGTLTINSTTATYTGATTVEAGTLNISSATSLDSPITVKAGATLGGEGATTSSLTFDTGTSTLSFDPTTPGSLTADNLLATGATIIASPSGATTLGVPYTVLTNSGGTFSAGDVSAFVAGGRGTMGGAGTNTITYTATAPAALTWKGNDGTNPTFWDVATTINWNNGSPDRFFGNDSVTFDNTANTFNVDVQGTSVSPGDMAFNHDTPNDYTVSGGTIGGSGSLTKNGSGTLSLTQAGTNAFSGALNINGGVLSISNLNQIGGTASTRAIQLGGGTLEYTYTTTNAQITESIPLALNSGDSTLAITGNYPTPNSVNTTTAPVTLRIGAPITGAGNLTKSGPGILAIGKNSVTTLGNTFSGTLTVTDGILDVRNPDALGDTSGGTIISNAQIELFAFGQNAGVTFDAEPLSLTGNSYFRSKNEDPDSDIEHVWTGPVTISAGAVVGIACIKQVSTSGVTPNTINSISPNISSLELSGPVTTLADSTLKLGLIQPSSTLPVVQTDVPQTVIISGTLSGAAAVETQGEPTSLYTLAAPQYAGNTTVNSGILSLGADNSFNNTSTVSIAATGATLELDFEGTDTVDKLIIGDVQQPAGIYKAVGNAAAGTTIPQLSGTGTLTVTTGPSGFNSWASSNGIPGALPGDDADLDGLSNLTEYALGTNPTASTPAPGTWSGNTITFTKGADAIANADVNYVIETSTDLGVNDPWTAAVTQTAPNSSTTIEYTFTPGSPSKKFARLRTVLIP